MRNGYTSIDCIKKASVTPPQRYIQRSHYSHIIPSR